MDGGATARMDLGWDGAAGSSRCGERDDDSADAATLQATSELAATYAALILADDNVEITVRAPSRCSAPAPSVLTRCAGGQDRRADDRCGR